MNSTPDGKATEPHDVSIVPADEQHAHADFQQITSADEQRVTKYTPNPKAPEPNDILIARADERLAHAYEQIARADEQLAHLNEHLSKLERDAARRPSAAAPGRVPSGGRPARRGLVALLFAAGIFVAALVSQSSYGDAARPIIARWAPQFAFASSPSLGRPGLPAQPSPTARLAAAAPAPLAQTAPQDVAPAAAPMSPELAQLLQTLARDLANVEQGIEQLKTSQEQMARDNAKATEQLKATREQMASVIANASKQNLQPKTTAPPSRPIATPTRKPVPTRTSPQARVQP